jgi:hypothetical protein
VNPYLCVSLKILDMSAIDYLLHESSVGYAIFQVVHQADTIGSRLKEVQDAAQDLAKFGKMVKLVNFAPYRYDPTLPSAQAALTLIQRGG